MRSKASRSDLISRKTDFSLMHFSGIFIQATRYQAKGLENRRLKAKSGSANTNGYTSLLAPTCIRLQEISLKNLRT
jgi:hypothetical protein